MRDFKPTYIIICLGANELFISNPDKNDTYIKQILAQIGDIPYIWIGPPNWKEDTGINAVIEKTIAPNRFFHSQRLQYERAKDGAHPTSASASKWMDSIAVWMNDSINYRISMRFPQQDVQSKGTTVLLQPLK
jgi:lysophospholipase L1-like esterase